MLNEEKLSGEELFMWKEKPSFFALKQSLGISDFCTFVWSCWEMTRLLGDTRKRVQYDQGSIMLIRY